MGSWVYGTDVGAECAERRARCGTGTHQGGGRPCARFWLGYMKDVRAGGAAVLAYSDQHSRGLSGLRVKDGEARVERPWEALTVAWGDVRAAVLGSH